MPTFWSSVSTNRKFGRHRYAVPEERHRAFRPLSVAAGWQVKIVPRLRQFRWTGNVPTEHLPPASTYHCRCGLESQRRPPHCCAREYRQNRPDRWSGCRKKRLREQVVSLLSPHATRDSNTNNTRRFQLITASHAASAAKACGAKFDLALTSLYSVLMLLSSGFAPMRAGRNGAGLSWMLRTQ